jgi:hypothetical protein
MILTMVFRWPPCSVLKNANLLYYVYMWFGFHNVVWPQAFIIAKFNNCIHLKVLSSEMDQAESRLIR